MQKSSERILTTHTGSLPRPPALVDLLIKKANHQPLDEAELARAGKLTRSVRLIFQPAEEITPGGALDVIADGGTHGLEQVFALHCDPKVEVGKIGFRAGSITAGADRISVSMRGPGGHTARPHLTADLVYALGAVVTGLPALLPAWGYGFWKSRDVYPHQDDAEEDVHGCRWHGIPLDAIVVDSPWETQYNTWEPNPHQFPDFAGMVARWRAIGAPRACSTVRSALPGRFATDVAANYAVPGRAKSSAERRAALRSGDVGNRVSSHHLEVPL